MLRSRSDCARRASVADATPELRAIPDRHVLGNLHLRQLPLSLIPFTFVRFLSFSFFLSVQIFRVFILVRSQMFHQITWATTTLDDVCAVLAPKIVATDIVIVCVTRFSGGRRPIFVQLL